MLGERVFPMGMSQARGPQATPSTEPPWQLPSLLPLLGTCEERPQDEPLTPYKSRVLWAQAPQGPRESLPLSPVQVHKDSLSLWQFQSCSLK